MILCSKNGFLPYEVHPNVKHSVPLWNWENSMSVVNLTRFISWNRDLFWYPQSYPVYACVHVCMPVCMCVQARGFWPLAEQLHQSPDWR